MPPNGSDVVLGTTTWQDLYNKFGYPYLHDPKFHAFVEVLVQERLLDHVNHRLEHLERTVEYFSHTTISPGPHQKDLAKRALAGERIYDL